MPLRTHKFSIFDRLGSLRARLMLLVVLALLPPIVLTIHSAIRERQHAIKVAETDLQRLTSVAAASETKTLEAMRQFLVALSDVPDLMRDPNVCASTLRSMLKKNNSYVNLGVLELNGDIRCSAVDFQGRVNSSDRSNVKKTLATKGFATSEYIYGRIVRNHLINATYPIFDADGVMIAMVFASLDLKVFDHFTTEIDFPINALMVTTDHDGTIIARRPDPLTWIGTRAQASLLDPMLKVGFGSAEITGSDGITRLHAFAPINTADSANYMISIGIPMADIVSSINQAQIDRLLALTLTAILALITTWFMANVTILNRINALVIAARRIAEGDYSSRSGIRYGSEEVSELASVFDGMAQSLQDSNAERDHGLQRLSCEKERLQTTLQSIGDAVITVNREERIEYMNLVAEVLTGWRTTEAIGRPLPEVFQVVNTVDDNMQSNTVYRNSISIARDGTEYTIEDSTAQIRDRAHAIVGTVIVFHDVTRSRALARQIALQASHDYHSLSSPKAPVLQQKLTKADISNSLETN